MIKQQLTGETWAIGGKPEEIIPLHTQMFNWQGIGFNNDDCEPLDMGAPEMFMYFLIKKENFLKAKAKAMLNALNPLPALSEKGKSCWDKAIAEANRQFDAFEKENFLHYSSLGAAMDVFEIENP
jgi:hypothetical protein